MLEKCAICDSENIKYACVDLAFSNDLINDYYCENCARACNFACFWCGNGLIELINPKRSNKNG